MLVNQSVALFLLFLALLIQIKGRLHVYPSTQQLHEY